MAKFDSFSAFNRTPWHGVGTDVTDCKTIDEAIIKAGLNWDVTSKKLYLQGEPLLHKDGLNTETVYLCGAEAPVLANYRTDTNKFLGVVKPGYNVLQNSKAFLWFQPFLDSGMARLEVAGALTGGKHIFILARITVDPVDVVDGDPVVCYLLLANGHDGSMAVWVGMTPIRVECANKLQAALGDADAKLLRIVHDKNLAPNMDMVQGTVNLATRQFEASVEQYQLLASRAVHKDLLKAYVRKVFAPKAETRKNLARRAVELEAVDRIFEKIEPLFETGTGMHIPGVRGTWWGAMNAVNEYLCYERGRSQGARLDSIFFGTAANLNQRALAAALVLAA